jgi:hypothetical protein
MMYISNLNFYVNHVPKVIKQVSGLSLCFFLGDEGRKLSAAFFFHLAHRVSVCISISTLYRSIFSPARTRSEPGPPIVLTDGTGVGTYLAAREKKS